MNSSYIWYFSWVICFGVRVEVDETECDEFLVDVQLGLIVVIQHNVDAQRESLRLLNGTNIIKDATFSK